MKIFPHTKGNCREDSPISQLPVGHFGYALGSQINHSLRRNNEGRLFVSETCKLTQRNLGKYKGPWFKVERDRGGKIILHIRDYDLDKIQKTTDLAGYVPIEKLFVNDAHFRFKNGQYFCTIADIEPQEYVLGNIQYWVPRGPLEVNGNVAFSTALYSDTPVKFGDYRLVSDYVTVRRTKAGTLEIWVGSGYGFPRGISGNGRGTWLPLKLNE